MAAPLLPEWKTPGPHPEELRVDPTSQPSGHVPSMVQPGGVVIEFSNERSVLEEGFMPKSVVQTHSLMTAVEGSSQPWTSPTWLVEFMEKFAS